jgi:hypothetical protein|mmetsp:Transcript_17443/g.23524  ORF Transcript_17443/g.23524 Transcript_17443/m.23524 type:complete len:82 (+) Transcript_17443:479-724(+)
MAKKFYEKQLQDRMAEKKTKNMTDREQWYKQLHDKEAKADKTVNDKRKEMNNYFKGKANDRKALEDERRRERNLQAQETAT